MKYGYSAKNAKPDRNFEIYKRRKAGETYVSIALSYGLKSPERIRQIYERLRRILERRF